MKTLPLFYTPTGGIAYGKTKFGYCYLNDNHKIGGPYKSRKFKIVRWISSVNSHTIIKNYGFGPKINEKVLYVENTMGCIIKDYRFLQKF